jgi:hypothetical protein
VNLFSNKITKESVTQNSIYFALLVNGFLLVHFCTPDDDGLVEQNILSFLYKILSQFVKPPSDTLLRYFNMSHLAPSPSSLQQNSSLTFLILILI